MQDDTALFRRIQERDWSAFTLLFDTYAESLYLYAAGFIGDQEEARDLVQDAFIYLWQKCMSLDFKGSLYAYLFRIVKNSCIDYKLHEKVKEKYFKETEVLQQEAEEEPEQFEILYQRVRDCVDSLPPKCKEIFILGCMDGLSYKEVADRLGVSVNTVKTQMKVAYRKVKSEFEDRNAKFVSALLTILLQYRGSFLKFI